MNLVCPACGFHAPFVNFTSETDARYFAQMMGQVPPEMADSLLRYLNLFAPAKHKLTFKRIRTLLDELMPMIKARAITRHRREWSVPPEMWAKAFDHVCDIRLKLTLPMRSHGYLLEVLTGAADKVEAKAEAAHIKTLRKPETREAPMASEAPVAMSELVRRSWIHDENKFRKLAGKPPMTPEETTAFLAEREKKS